MAATPISAKNARVIIGGAALSANQWRVRCSGGTWDGTTFEAAGYAEPRPGVRSANVFVSGFWDSAVNMHADPPLIQDAIFTGTVNLYTNGVGSPSFFFTTLLVDEVTVAAEVRGGIMFEFTGLSFGAWSYPS